jgi:tyrosyl-tRNA synthetase
MSDEDLVHVPALLAEKFGVSRSEARRALAQGGVRLNGWTLHDMDVDAQNLAGGELRLGKNRKITLD